MDMKADMVVNLATYIVGIWRDEYNSKYGGDVIGMKMVKHKIETIVVG